MYARFISNSFINVISLLHVNLRPMDAGFDSHFNARVFS